MKIALAVVVLVVIVVAIARDAKKHRATPKQPLDAVPDETIGLV